MIITECTLHVLDFRAHATQEEAVQYLLDQLGPDYTDGPVAHFWPSENGKQLMEDDGMRDFSAVVHATAQAAIEAHAWLDDDGLPTALHALAVAIQDGIDRGLEV